ncbi:leucine-rich repeat flightless-interacting protein 2-like isoform X6 [Lethenteron reissneri]|uniref:leucine-rich repeat flightless-interacting protein 2-like isoform X6 n=1 Tax=Lethenteron reissneri TaxID=7753 RepID=UPI002AB6FE95|nr:leucine-rich repeat flightless-interacting protein 2-like isoform X6 [Lethenteron reissneri]
MDMANHAAGVGRRRASVKDRFSAEDEALSQIAREAEARLAAKRAARAEAREFRMRDLEKQQKEPSECSFYPGSSSRASSRASSLRASPVLDEKSDREGMELVRPTSLCRASSGVSGLSAATLASLGNGGGPRGGPPGWEGVRGGPAGSSRRGSGDTSASLESEACVRELRDSLGEAEERYRRAMVRAAQLDNEKAALAYEVEALRDALEGAEESLAQEQRRCEQRGLEVERHRQACSILEHKSTQLQAALAQREQLMEENARLHVHECELGQEVLDLQETVGWKDKKIAALERHKAYCDSLRAERDDEPGAEVCRPLHGIQRHGLAVVQGSVCNGEQEETGAAPLALVSRASARILDALGDGPLDVRLTKLTEERDGLEEQVRRLKSELEAERQKGGGVRGGEVGGGPGVGGAGEAGGPDDFVTGDGAAAHVAEMQREAQRQVSELKFKVAKAEQEKAALEQNVLRLEAQALRLRGAAEGWERTEDELKAERRRLQRELRAALDRLDELQLTNGHLVRRLDKMKANRSALLSQQ